MRVMICGKVVVFALCLTSMVSRAADISERDAVLQNYPADVREKLAAGIDAAGTNRTQILKALASVSGRDRSAMQFLVLNMPKRDLRGLTSDFLLDNVRLSRKARETCSWGAKLPDEIYFNNVLPYASLNERRDNWRADFYKRFAPLVAKCTSPGEAALILNREVFRLFNVHYHATKRRKPDQSPYESIKLGFASCTGLSILLVDACRSAGVPARIAGTPMWTTRRGNHTWVEVWSGGSWHFIGAAESSRLDDGWFIADAAAADPSKPLHWIYASSFKKTALHFPLIWDLSIDYVPAENVTEFYRGFGKKAKAGGTDAEQKAMNAAEKKIRRSGAVGK